MHLKTCFFAGHRKIPIKHIEKIKNYLKIEIENLINEGIIYFVSGCAIGFDTLAAKTVLLLKESYWEIKLVIVIAHSGQELAWTDSQKEEYYQILNAADKVYTLSKKYYNGVYSIRNRHLIAFSKTCIIYCNKKTGSIAFSMTLAKNSGLRVINLNQYCIDT